MDRRRGFSGDCLLCLRNRLGHKQRYNRPTMATATSSRSHHSGRICCCSSRRYPTRLSWHQRDAKEDDGFCTTDVGSADEKRRQASLTSRSSRSHAVTSPALSATPDSNQHPGFSLGSRSSNRFLTACLARRLNPDSSKQPAVSECELRPEQRFGRGKSMSCPDSVYWRGSALCPALAILRNRGTERSLKPACFIGGFGSCIGHQRHG